MENKAVEKATIFQQNIGLIGQIDKAIFYFREQEHMKALELLARVVPSLEQLVQEVLADRAYFGNVSAESVMEMVEGLIAAKRKKDYVLLTDLLELQVDSFVCGIQALLLRREDCPVYEEDAYWKTIEQMKRKLEAGMRAVSTASADTLALSRVNRNAVLEQPLNPTELLELGYRVEYTTCGLMTLAAVDADGEDCYLHTNHKVEQEAFLLARNWYTYDIKEYVVYGFGMGYHVRELRALAPHAKITIYEPDMNILKLSCAFSALDELLSDERIALYFDLDYSLLRSHLLRAGQTDKICCHYPSLRLVREHEARELLMSHIRWADLLEEC